MQDLEQRYFERLRAAQVKHNEALDAARSEHDAEVMAAREELNEKASGRFSVLFGKSPPSAPSEAVKGLIEGMIADVLNQKFAEVERRAIAPPSDEAEGRDNG